MTELYEDFQQVFTYVDNLTVGTNIGLEPYDFEQFGNLVTGADVDIVPVSQQGGIDEALYMVTLWTTDTEWGIMVEDNHVLVVHGDLTVHKAVHMVQGLDEAVCDALGAQVDRSVLEAAAKEAPRTIYMLATLAPLFTEKEGA